MRLRFAPSPTGPLHIGGVRTALYNYLLAKKSNGSFILRIEDTDQNRFVKGAEEYIQEALEWCGIIPDESPFVGGPYGPYRQSERKHLYREYADQLVANGHAYYAFDTPESLDAQRKEDPNFIYGHRVRMKMKNSLSLPKAEVQNLLSNQTPFVVRLKIPETETITFNDLIRGTVSFQGSDLDDKIILKGDGWPTYHLANIVDDYLMKITHVIRGEEWLSSTPHHILLYKMLGWEDKMPQFAHLPLLLKPSGKGKLSKRDGQALGIPVFPIDWKSNNDHFDGFREKGFLPEAVINFLALLGWNPGDERELFSLAELIESFDLEKVGKSGSRFDIEKAKWFNQQYIIHKEPEDLANLVAPILQEHQIIADHNTVVAFCQLMKERVNLLEDFWTNGYYFFKPVQNYDEKMVRKKWSSTLKPVFLNYLSLLEGLDEFAAEKIQTMTSEFMESNSLSPGQVLPILRLGLAGTMKGPAVFEMMELLGKEMVRERMETALTDFDNMS
jgi:glutamyl-tRNA synthetase